MVLSCLLPALGCSSGSGSRTATGAPITTPEAIRAFLVRQAESTVPVTTVDPGSPVSGLSAEESRVFEEGRTVFSEAEGPDDGLGPVFNGTSCVECHSQGGVGGAAFDSTVSVVTRIGGEFDGQYTDLEEKGGAVLQRRSIREFDPTSPVLPETVPPEATFVSKRTTTPLFGAGLMEAVSDATLESLADPEDRDRDGISGRVNHVVNPETQKTEVGRFGWKSQISSLTVFAADAYLHEMGITTPLFPIDLLPQGKAIPGADTVPEPEDDGADIPLFAGFMRFLGPPTTETDPAAERGAVTFQKVGCVSCHIPELPTGKSESEALAGRRIALYSDLLLHDMGPGLADGIRQGQATGSEFRTAPLWGIRLRKFLLHDGRAGSIREAIDWHGGEASQVIANFRRLNSGDAADLIRFVETR
ncbi:MAG: di-heme oxidoredictase family protein [Capsulimonadales bacterium]|nr:di-heme oxidoredictase family protein [Capsulimonadales bacterium]